MTDPAHLASYGKHFSLHYLLVTQTCTVQSIPSVAPYDRTVLFVVILLGFFLFCFLHLVAFTFTCFSVGNVCLGYKEELVRLSEL